MACGENDIVKIASDNLAGNDIYLAYPVDLVAKKLYPHRNVGGVSGHYLNSIPSYPELGTGKTDIVSFVLYADKVCDKLFSGLFLTLADRYHHRLILLGVAHRVDTRNAGDYDDVTALCYCGGRRVAQPVDILVDVGVLLDINVLAGDISFGLVIVVIRNKVFHRVVWQVFCCAQKRA